MDFPIGDLMDEPACSARLVERLHPGGLTCPRCHRYDRRAVHRHDRDRVTDFRCGHCRRVFNAFTGTALHGIRRRPRGPVLIVRGFAQGVPTARLARELCRDRSELLNLRHRLRDLAFGDRDIMSLDDRVLEADETYRDAGERRRPASRPGGPAEAPDRRDARARHLGERPAAGPRRRRAGERVNPARASAH
jgi:transposase-like protein